MRLRISLFALLIVVAVLGPGSGLVVRGYHEWERSCERERTLNFIESEWQRAKRAGLGEEDGLKRVQFIVDNSPDLNAEDRQQLGAKVAEEIKRARGKAIIELRQNRGC